MVKIKPFCGIRPPKQYASEVASRPYDVLNSAEAKAEATERSLLHIIKPEIDFEPIADEHSQEVYDKAVENFRAWREKGWLEQDPGEYYYIYAQTMDGRTQYGLTMCCHYEDYLSGAIKKHELTRPDKEEDRMIHVRNQQANIEPVFFAYPDNAEIDAIVADVVKNNDPEYDFTAADGFGHKLWVIRDKKTNDRITEIFAGIPALYVADGHHRTAAAARVGWRLVEPGLVLQNLLDARYNQAELLYVSNFRGPDAPPSNVPRAATSKPVAPQRPPSSPSPARSGAGVHT